MPETLQDFSAFIASLHDQLTPTPHNHKGMQALYGYLALHYLHRQRPAPGRYLVKVPRAGLTRAIIKAEKLDASDPNTRWITLKPHGDDEDAYVRVLVKINPDGTGNVLSGGEGLRGLKLNKLRSPQEWQESSRERAKERRAKKRQEREAEKKKRKEEDERAKQDPQFAEQLKARRAEEAAEKERVAQERSAFEKRLTEKRLEQAQLAKELGLEGWEDLDPDVITDPEKVRQRLGDTPGAGLVVGQQRRRVTSGLRAIEKNLVRELAENHALRAEVLEDERAGVNPEDAIATKPTGGMGFKRTDRAEAAERGMDEAELKRRSRELAERRIEVIAEHDPQRAAGIRTARSQMDDMHLTAKALRESGEGGPQLDREVDPEALKERAEQVKQFLKLAEESKRLERELRSFSADTDELATVIQSRTPAAFDLDAEAANEEFLTKLRQDVEESAKLDLTKSFFDELNFEEQGLDFKTSQKVMLGKVSHAAYAHLNSAMLTTLGSSNLDRRTLDTLGVEGATQLTAWKLRKELSDEDFNAVRDGLKAFHDQKSVRIMEEATEAAQRAKAAALELNLPMVQDAASLVAAKELNAERQHLLEEAIGELSAALGQVEAGAALNLALRSPPKRAINVRYGKEADNKQVLAGLAALGLEEHEDYGLERTPDENELRLSLTESALEKLTPAEAPSELAHRERLEAIRRGTMDEDDWLPAGFSRYPLNVHNHPDFVDPHAFAVPPGFREGQPVTNALQDFVASRIADGWKASDILRDMMTTDFILKNVPQAQESEFFKALNDLFPAQNADGSGRNVDTDPELQGRYEKMAKDFIAREHPDEADFHSQSLDIDDNNTRRAAFLAVANDPRLMSAYTPYEQLTNEDRQAVRGFYLQDIAGLDRSGVNRQALEKALEEIGEEPEREGEGMFGTSINPAWSEWQSKRQKAFRMHANPAEWREFVRAMGGVRRAYAATQEVMRGKFNEQFDTYHANLTGQKAFRTGLSGIPRGDAIKQAVDPAAREEARAERKSRMASLRERQAGSGKFAAEGEGAVIEKLQQQLERERLMQQSSIGLFGDSPVETSTLVEPRREVQDRLTERFSLGHRAEQQLASLIPTFRGGIKPTTPGVSVVENATMGKGTRFVPQQRAIKFAVEAGKSAQALGMGSGKTNVAIGTFTELHSRGQASKALMVVPSAVRDQFSQEMATFTEPGTYRWHAEDSTFEQRLNQYKNPDTHMHVVTHQSFRDDMLTLMTRHYGGEHMDREDVQQAFEQRPPQERRQMLRQALRAEGVESLLDYVAVDEGHVMLGREGKPDSLMAAIGDAAMQEAKHGIFASGTPVKNDASEVYDVLRKLDPDRWEGEARENEFKRRYGNNLPVTKDAFMREARRYVYASSIPSGAPRKDVWDAEREDGTQAPLELTSAQSQRLEQVNIAFERARQARREGSVDVDAMKQLSPNSFEGAPATEHEAIARRLNRSLGTLRFAAESRAIDTTPPQENAKVQRVLELARSKQEAGQPGVVFAHSLEAVRILKDALEAEGHRVDTITGGDSSQEKGAKRTRFKPDTGDAETDILILSDAGAAGLNLQRGQWLVNYDIPLTHATWKQRNARIDRVGQHNAVEIHTLATDTRFDRDAMRRLERKGALQDIFEENWEALDDTGLAKYINMASPPPEFAEAAD